MTIASECADERIGIPGSGEDGSFRARVPLGGTVDLIVISDTLAGELRGVAAGSECLDLDVRPR